jgi:hypothetical protein
MPQTLESPVSQAVSALVAQAPETSPRVQTEPFRLEAGVLSPNHVQRPSLLHAPEPSVHPSSDPAAARRGRVARAAGKPEPRRVAVYFPPDLGDTLAVWCAQHHRNMSDTVVEAVRQWFERLGS